MLRGEESVTVAVTVTGCGGLFFFGLVDDQGLRGEEQGRDRAGVGQRGTRHLDRVQDALGQQVAVLTGGGVEAAADLDRKSVV